VVGADEGDHVASGDLPTVADEAALALGRKNTDGRTTDGKWIDRWVESGRKRERTFDRKGDRDAIPNLEQQTRVNYKWV
jgi:hypothetical protein